MPLRNPFRRQTETAAPSLRERAANLRATFTSQAATASDTARPDECADLYDRLLAAYTEERAARPISGRDGDEAAKRAANLVIDRAWGLAREILALPSPKTMTGLRATALASMILCEADYSSEDPTSVAAAGLTRAVFAATGTPFPSGFCGFGDEPDHRERDRALHSVLGSLPAWAVAEIEAEDAPFVQDIAGSDPVALSAAILDGWAAWGATTGAADATAEDLVAWERASAKRDHLLYAAMALPATPETIEAKALACAWMEWVNTERPGQPRDDYGPADQLVYDIHATIMRRGQRDPNAVAPVPFTLSEAALVPTVDFAGASMSELREIYRAAELVCEVASTAAHNRHGRAGKLTRWVSNALCAVLTEAENEARRRAPSNSDDRATRLSMICGTVLDNEDPAETAAFARELLAMVER